MIRTLTRRATLVLLVTACTGGGDGGTGPGGTNGTNPGTGQVLSGTIDVRINGASFSPNNITIARGSTVRWINDSGAYHTITPENAGQAGAWQRQEVSASGVVFQHSFGTSGQTYRYRCEPHSSGFTQGMVGSIRVE